jgi:hypothetical protein
MNRTVHAVLFVGTLVAMLPSLSAQVHLKQTDLEMGQQWLSWTSAQRNSYVYGFIDGYMKGTVDACLAADELFEVGQPHRLGDEHHPTEVPSGRCLARVDREYSKGKLTESGMDTSAYTSVITEFYTKHPEYRRVPFSSLLLLLSDKKHKTAEELYAMALKGEIRRY